MYAPLSFLATDPDGAMNTWIRTLAEQCVCACPPPPFRIGFSRRARSYDNQSFGDWSEYDFESSAGLYIAVNTDAEQPGGDEVQIRIRFEISPNERAGVIRYRQIFGALDAQGRTVLTGGDVHVIPIPTTGTAIVTVDYGFIPCAVGQSSFLSGPPGGGVAGYSAERQTAFLLKKGFRQYVGDSAAINIYRQEFVNSGGDPGCVSSSRPARTYSGNHRYEDSAATPNNNYIADPVGTFVTSLSADLVADKHATTPFGQPSKTVEFGAVAHPSNTAKTMEETFTCGGVKVKSLELVLTDEYTTAQLRTAVTTALDLQLANGLSVAPASDSRVVHRDWLSPGEIRYERVRTTLLSFIVSGFDGILGGPGQVVTMHGTANLAIRNLGSGTTGTRSLAFIAVLQASGEADTGLAGRASVEPSNPVPPISNPFENGGDDDSEILITSVTVLRNALLSVVTPIVEDPAVLDEGYE